MTAGAHSVLTLARSAMLRTKTVVSTLIKRGYLIKCIIILYGSSVLPRIAMYGISIYSHV